MTLEFTENGISVDTFQEIYDRYVAGYQAAYGNDINTDPDSPDGQRIGIEARSVLDMNSFALALYQQLDPNFAIGQALNRLVKFAGISRKPGAKSQVDLTLVSDRTLTLNSGFVVQDDLGQKWETISDYSISIGSNTVTVFSQEIAAIEADPDTITTIITFVPGVTSVTNATAATVGKDEETDEQLKIRRNNSLESQNSSSIGRLYNAVGELDGVTDLRVIENDTDTTDSDGVPAHSLWIIVEGGDVDEIAEALAKNKTGGKGMVGDIDGTWEETITRPDGSTFEYIHEMTFQRPDYQALSVRLTATRKSASDPVDEDLIKNAIVSKSFIIGENAIASSFYCLLSNAGDNFIPTDMEISIDTTNGTDGTWTDGRILSELDGKFTLDADDVYVTEVTP